MKYLKIFEEFKLGVVYTPEEGGSVSKIDVNGFEVIFIDYSTPSEYKMIYTVEILGKLGTLAMSGLCFSNVDVAKKYIKKITDGNKEQGPLPKDTKFVIRGLTLDEGDASNNIYIDTEFETPPKWVKNPKSWAMDKIVSLLTPESNIHQLATTFVESGVFDFKDLKNLESSIKAIYQSSKDKKEVDVKDHIRRFGLSSKIGVHKWKGDQDKIDLAKKFENLLGYFQD